MEGIYGISQELLGISDQDPFTFDINHLTAMNKQGIPFHPSDYNPDYPLNQM